MCALESALSRTFHLSLAMLVVATLIMSLLGEHFVSQQLIQRFPCSVRLRRAACAGKAATTDSKHSLSLGSHRDPSRLDLV